MNFGIICLATFMACWLLASLIPRFPPHWRVALLVMPIVAFGLLSVPPHYSRYIVALAVGAVVMIMGKLTERFLGHLPEAPAVPVIRRGRIHRRLRGPRGRRFVPDEAAPRRRSEVPPL